MAEALSRGDGGVSHSGGGEKDAQVLDGAPETFSFHLEQKAERMIFNPNPNHRQYFSLQVPLMLIPPNPTYNRKYNELL